MTRVEGPGGHGVAGHSPGRTGRLGDDLHEESGWEGTECHPAPPALWFPQSQLSEGKAMKCHPKKTD